MRQLSAAASSAAAVAAWVRAASDRLAAPLGSLRLLLSPSSGELDHCSQLPAESVEATRENFRNAALAWREDCATDRDNVALFYFAGHGVQRTRSDAVLLMRDFLQGGGNPLYNAVDVNNLFGGLAPTVERPDIARTQLWFIDACRNFPSEFERFEELQAAEVFEPTLGIRDDRSAPIYYGALPGGNAYSVVGQETLFSRALFETLGGAGGQRAPGQQRWRVTTGSLLRGMQAMIEYINAEEGSDQEIWDGGQNPRPDTPVLDLNSVPEVRVRLELLPHAAVHRLALAVERHDGATVQVPNPLTPNPFVTRWTAGIYRLRATPPHPGILEDPEPVMPPSFPWSAEVTL